MKVILADDHALFRDGFALLLKQHIPEAECVIAQTFDEALARLDDAGEVDLLLLDLGMPGMQGVKSIETVQARHAGLPIVILSAEEARQTMEALLAAGVAGFIPKASSAAVMVSAIRLILAGGVYVPPQVVAAGEPVRRPAVAVGAMHLTQRQHEVLRLLAKGLPNKLICRELDMSEGTLKTHVNAIYRVLNVINRTEAALEAKRLGIVD